MEKIKQYRQSREMLIMELMKFNQNYYKLQNEISGGKDVLSSIKYLQIFNPFVYSEHPDRFFIREDVSKVNPSVEDDAKFKTNVCLVYHLTHTEAMETSNPRKREYTTPTFITYDDLEDMNAWLEKMKASFEKLYAPEPTK